MISLSKFFSSTIESGKRILKVKQFGIKTAKECYPFGFDSSPIENMTAIFSETTNANEQVIIGYINKNQLAQAGESRMYSVAENGTIKAFIHLKTDGRIYLNGEDFSAVRFENLQTSLQSTDAAINAELVKIGWALGLVGGVYTPLPISTNISSSKSDTVKIK